MTHLFTLLFAAAISGTVAVAVSLTMFYLIEQKRPILKGLPSDKVAGIIGRLSVCLWFAVAVIYVLLTYLWK
jgi:hypothetical protein